jgi:hypothetical protein
MNGEPDLSKTVFPAPRRLIFLLKKESKPARIAALAPFQPVFLLNEEPELH